MKVALTLAVSLSDTMLSRILTKPVNSFDKNYVYLLWFYGVNGYICVYKFKGVFMDRVKRIRNEYGQYVDVTTGEGVEPFGERFMFVRYTDGLDWMSGLNGNEIRAYMFLASKTSRADTKVSIDKRVRSQMCIFLDVHERTMYRILDGLEVAGLIKKLDTAYYDIAPFGAYKFHSRDMGKKVERYLGM